MAQEISERVEARLFSVRFLGMVLAHGVGAWCRAEQKIEQQNLGHRLLEAIAHK